MNTVRKQILEASLTLPSYEKFLKVLGADTANLANSMFIAMFRAYLQNKGAISLPYWADKFDCMESFNIILKSLSDSKWIISDAIPARNWAEAKLNEDKLLQYVSASELENIRANKKFQHYIMDIRESTKTSATRVNGKIKDTGLVRKGAMLAGRTLFSIDIEALKLNEFTIKREMQKGMDKVIKIIEASGGAFHRNSATYDAILNTTLEAMINNPSKYTRGNSYNDTRGRAISESLSKIGNPISNKTIRALLVIE